jgi:hypothetical protein
MTTKIKYAYLSGQVWIYRRNYPQDVRVVLGAQALKQSLKTSDPRVARARVAEVDLRYETIVTTTRSGGTDSTLQAYSWVTDGTTAMAQLRASLNEQVYLSIGQPVSWVTSQPALKTS